MAQGEHMLQLSDLRAASGPLTQRFTSLWGRL